MLFRDVKIIPSAEGNVSKYVFTAETGVAEAVLYRYPDYQTRTVICCSTMSGCPVGCRFCGAGDYFVRTRSRWREEVMGVEYREFITRIQLKREPFVLFVFGDNMERFGHGGQAREMRGEPNAVGIPTKWAPNMSPTSFFSDADFDEVKPSIDAAFDRLRRHVHQGGRVVWPKDGIGSGLADLPRRAPKIWEYIEDRRMNLESHP